MPIINTFATTFIKMTYKSGLMNVHLIQCYPPMIVKGFTTVSLLTYANLEHSADSFFSGMEPQVNHSYKINSKVVTASVSNRNTSHLKEPVTLTFHHLKVAYIFRKEYKSISAGKHHTCNGNYLYFVSQPNESHHTCVFWDSSLDGGSWSTRGCKMVESNSEYTVCSCNHLSSFAVLMALYDVEVKTLTYMMIYGKLWCFYCIVET